MGLMRFMVFLGFIGKVYKIKIINSLIYYSCMSMMPNITFQFLSDKICYTTIFHRIL